jgi:acyl phosphate:glycerol-3-phosphate acyltransferase
MWSEFLFVSAAAYFLGSIPFGLILVRLFRGVDVRTIGSGNIGTANVARLAPSLGLWTLILDSGKGLAAVLVARIFVRHAATHGADLDYIPALLGAAALCAVIGHMFPVWLKFKGGKGVATALGAFVAIQPIAVLITLAIYVAIYLSFHYTSLASIASAALFPVLAGVLMKPSERLVLLPFLLMTSLLIIVKHHQNIRRLLAGTENRLELRRH